MSTTTEYATAAQDQVLGALKQSQDAVIKAVETWTGAIGQLPAPAIEIPFADELPKPEEIVETTFDFAQKLLDAQRDFSRNVLRAAASALPAPSSAK
jgi:hypothetical protein